MASSEFQDRPTNIIEELRSIIKASNNIHDHYVQIEHEFNAIQMQAYKLTLSTYESKIADIKTQVSQLKPILDKYLGSIIMYEVKSRQIIGQMTDSTTLDRLIEEKNKTKPHVHEYFSKKIRQLTYLESLPNTIVTKLTESSDLDLSGGLLESSPGKPTVSYYKLRSVNVIQIFDRTFDGIILLFDTTTLALAHMTDKSKTYDPDPKSVSGGYYYLLIINDSSVDVKISDLFKVVLEADALPPPPRPRSKQLPPPMLETAMYESKVAYKINIGARDPVDCADKQFEIEAMKNLEYIPLKVKPTKNCIFDISKMPDTVELYQCEDDNTCRIQINTRTYGKEFRVTKDKTYIFAFFKKNDYNESSTKFNIKFKAFPPQEDKPEESPIRSAAQPAPAPAQAPAPAPPSSSVLRQLPLLNHNLEFDLKAVDVNIAYNQPYNNYTDDVTIPAIPASEPLPIYIYIELQYDGVLNVSKMPTNVDLYYCTKHESYSYSSCYKVSRMSSEFNIPQNTKYVIAFMKNDIDTTMPSISFDITFKKKL